MSKLFQQLFSKSKTLVFIFSFFLGGQIWGQCQITNSSISPLCSGENTGQITASVSTQCGCPYSSSGIYWRIVHPTLGVLHTSQLVFQNSYSFINLPGLVPPAAYTIQISVNENVWSTGAGGTICSQGTIGLPDYPLIVAVSSNVTNVLCNGFPTGSISISANGGYYGGFGDPCQGYNVTWTGPTPPPNGVNLNCPPEIVASNYQMNNLLAGNYIIIVDDFNNCDDTILVTITQPPPISPIITTTNANCATDAGSIVVGGLNGQDGTPSNLGFNISWQLTGAAINNPAGIEIQAPGFLNYTIPQAPTYPLLVPGTYAITIIDNNGCVNSSQQTIILTNPSPIISGNTQMCTGTTQQLSISNNQPPVAGNAWSSSNSNVISVNASTGVVTAAAPGSATITFTSLSGCTGTFTINVNATPTFTLSNPPTLCAGQTASITATSTPNIYNYVWNTLPVTTQNAVSTSSVTVSPGSNTIYTATATNATTGCSSSQNTTVTVYPLPVISGGTFICVNAQSQLTGTATAANNNAWVSNNTGVATISASGLVSALSIGTAQITYTNSLGCNNSVTVNVVAFPVITGPSAVCLGSSIQLSGSGTASTWQSSNQSVATVNSTGLVSGISVGNTTITYITNTGCQNTTPISVNPVPTITGLNSVCVNNTITLTGSGTAAAWSSSNNSIATVSSIGVVTGVSAGTVSVTYTNNFGCNASTTVTVNANPIITGSNALCLNGTLQLNGNGTAAANNPWVSSNTGVATISNSGLITGISVGTSNITYTNLAGCSSSLTVTVNPIPTISGNIPLCVGQTNNLIGSGTPNTSTPWSSSAPLIASVSNLGVITALAPGQTTITYTSNLGCIKTVLVQVNANPSISGNLSLCVNATSQLTGSASAATNTPWTSSNTGVATISASGLVTAVSPGNTTITYANSNGCQVTASVTVYANPTITGNNSLCVGSTLTLTGNGTAAASNAWISSNTAVATVTNLGVVTGVAAGTTTITYTNSNNCLVTSTVTVNALPTVTGNTSLCIGTTSQLTGSPTASTWASNAIGIATVSNTGLINAVSAGSANITYTNSNGCNLVVPVTVFANPTITGGVSLCVSSTLQLTGSGTAAAANSWASSNTAVATISNAGLVTAVSAGTTTITYTNNNNCSVTSTVTVNALPTVTGNNTLCAGTSTSLTGSPTSAVTTPWSSSNAAIASITNGGVVNGVTAGSVVITYTNSVGCVANFNLTVNATTIPIFSQLGPYCVNGNTGTLPLTSNNGSIAGTWSPAAISTTTAGTSVYTFTPTSTAPNTCAINTTMSVVVTTLPSATIGASALSVCQNSAQPNITFTGSNSSPPYSFTYNINGGANQTITTSSGSSISLLITTANAGTFTYNLTSVAVGSCSNPITNTSITITVNPNITPTFTQVGPYCNGQSIPTLPTTSTNSISGSWAPAINNIAISSAVTTNYTFTPTSGPGICATTANMPIVVNPNTTPLFTQLGPYCQGATPDAFPTTSNNGIAGSWSPAAISAASPGSTPYTFSPTSSAPNTCAINTTMSVVVTTLPSATIGASALSVCQNSAQPNITFTGSNSSPPYSFTYNINGGANQTITTSSGSSISLPITTANAGTFTYNLTSVAVGSCSNPITNTSITITVNPNITPTFTQVGPYCNGQSIPTLPTTSTNSISGSWAPAINNIAISSAVTTNYTFTPTSGPGICATTANMPIVVNPNTTPLFTQLGPYCQGATPDAFPTTSNNGIAGSWSPAAISAASPGSTPYTFSPTSSAPNTCAINTTMSVVVTTLPSATIGASALSVCQNSAQPNITFSGSNSSPPYSFTYNINDGANQTITTSSGSSISLPITTANAGTFTYNLTSVAVGSCSNPITNTSITITVNPNITPTFTQVGPYCNGQSIPTLPTTSTNSISGSWAPAINNIAISSAVTTNYTFTPTSGPGICATTANMPIVVNPNTTPLFTQLGPYCQGATPDAFPTTSNNGIAGSWSPAAISAASPGSTPYTFSPTSSAPNTCAINTTMSVVVTTLPSATIGASALSVCQNSAQPNITFSGSNSSPPYSFTYNINDGANQTITTSSGSSISLPITTANAGTFTYNLTSVAVGSCSNPITNTSITITVNPNITPTFTQVGPYCNGQSIPTLPTTSTNSISGSWAPAINNIAISSAVTTNYTFTPTSGPGICATTANMPIVVNPNTTPLFTQLGPYCQGATPDAFPTTSNNGIAGSWSPAAISAASPGSTPYTFSPTSSAPNTCAINTTMSVVVTTLPSATIGASALSVCQNSAQPNITFSGSNSSPPYSFTYNINDGANQTITTSSGSSISLPITTANAGTFTYNLTSVAVGSCSNPITNTSITITVNPNITPTFTQVGPYCNGQSIPTLPTTSTNSISGSWAPAINNIAISSAVTTNYTFTPTSGPGICATTANMPIVVNPNTTPLFTQLGPYCQGATPDAFPTTSNNGIAGSWSPAAISAASPGSTPYTFSPTSSAPNTCAINTTMSVVVTTLPSATIGASALSVCQNSAQPNITFSGSNSSPPYSFTYNINGGANQTITTSSGSSISLPITTANAGTFTYNLTSVAVGSCSNPITNTSITITVNPNITPTFTQVGPYCNGQSIPTLPTTSTNSISGTWAPAINNIAISSAVTTNYTFTPTSGPGICATTANMPIVVNPNTTPQFTLLGPYCQGATPDAFPTTSNNGIAGSWSPAAISAASPGSTPYTFSPTSSAPNACATIANMSISVTTLPLATIGGTTTLCQNATPPSITFTGSNSTPPYTFTYTINGGAPQTVTTSGTNSSVTVAAPTSIPGSYSFNLNSVTVGNCSNPINTNNTATITVFENPTIVMPNQIICGGNPITINPNVTPIGGQYLWTGPLVNNLTSNSITVSPTNNSSYSLNYTLDGCSTNQSVTINVIQNPAASVSPQTICFGDTVVLVAGPNGASYSWTGNNIIGPTNLQQIQVNPSSTTTYTVTIQIDGCATSSTTALVTVNPIPTVDAAPEIQSICNGEIATISSTVNPGGGTYQWQGSTVNGQSTATISINPVLVNPTVTETFQYILTYSANGCTGIKDTVEVEVKPKPVISVNDLIICSGVSDTMEANPNLPGGTYYWSTGITGLLDSSIIVSQITNPSNQVTIYNYNAWYILNGCSSDTIPSVVTVSPIPVITTANPAPICSGTPLNIPLTSNTAGTTFSWYASVNPNVTGESTTAQATNTINDLLIITPTTGIETVNYFAINRFNGCADTFQLSVVVNPTPFINTINDIICSGGSFDTIPNANALGNFIPSGTTYSWSVAANNLVLNDTGNDNQNPNIFNSGPLTSSSINNTILAYSVTPTAGVCPGPVFNVNITVTPTPSISNQLYSICSGNFPTITALPGDVIPSSAMYTWTIVSENENINGQINQGVGVSDLSNQVLVNQTNIPQSLTYSITPSSGPCPGSPFTLTVTVNPGPSIDTALYTICSGNSLTVTLGQGNDIITVGTTFIWNVMPNTNITGQTSNNIPSPNFFTGTLQNFQSVNDTLEYWLTPTGPANQNPQCNGSPFPVFVIVKPTPNLSNTLLNDICSGTSFTYDPNQNLTPSSIYNANTVLTWTVTPNLNVSGWTNSVGTNNPTITQILTNLTNTVQTVVYNATANDTLSLCSSTVFSVTVNVQPTPLIQSQTASVCSGNPFVITPSITNNQPTQIVPNGILYSWATPTSNPPNLIIGGSAQTNQASISQVLNIQPPNPPQFGSLTYIVVPSYPVSASLTCQGLPFNVTVNVNPIPIIDTAFAQPETICFGSISTLQAVALPNLIPPGGTYNWTPIAQLSNPLATTAIITTLPLNNTTTFIVTYTLPANLGSCQSQAYPVTVTVQAPPNILTITAVENEFCVGGCTNITANFVGAVAVDSVQWSTGQVTYFFPHSIQVCPNDTTTYTATAFLGGCNGNIANININVNPDPIISLQPYTDTAICVGGTLPLTIQVLNGAGNPTYQWYQNQINSNIGGTLLPSPPPFGPSYQPQPFNTAGSFYYYCVISYAPSGCGFLTTLPSEINVIADPIVQIIGQDETLCIGGTPQCLNAVISGGIGNVVQYEWNQGGSDSTFCPPNIPIGIEDYTVSVLQTGVGCSSNSIDTITVSILPDPIITIIGITAACEGAIVPLSTSVTGGIGNVVQYQWQEANPIGSPYLPIVNSNSNNYTTLPLLNDVGYSVSIIQSGNGCAATDIHAIMIYDDPQLNLIGSPYSCLGEETSITANILGGTPSSTNSLTWYAYPAGVINPLIIQGPNNDLTYDFLLTGDTTIYVESINSGFGCDLVTESITIQGLTPAVASFEVSNTIQTLIDPTFSFTNTSENATDYFWNLGECDPQAPASELFTTPTPFYNPTNQDQMEYTYGCAPGLYQIMLIAYNQGICPDTAYQVIQIQDGVSVYIPNTFTPDGDMTNQYFFPVISSIISPNTFLFSIYNRWGEEVFISKDPNEKWDGNNYITNNKCQDGVYIWKLRFIMKESGEVINKVGHVNLLR